MLQLSRNYVEINSRIITELNLCNELIHCNSIFNRLLNHVKMYEIRTDNIGMQTLRIEQLITYKSECLLLEEQFKHFGFATYVNFLEIYPNKSIEGLESIKGISCIELVKSLTVHYVSTSVEFSNYYKQKYSVLMDMISRIRNYDELIMTLSEKVFRTCYGFDIEEEAIESKYNEFLKELL